MGFRSTTKTAYIETEVDVDLDDFDIDDIVDYVEYQGYSVFRTQTKCGIENLDERIWKLYDAWMHDDTKNFEKEMRVFFADYYNKVSV